MISRNKVSGKIISKKNGWIKAEIHGDVSEMGFANGYLFSNELIDIVDKMHHFVKTKFSIDYSKYIHDCLTYLPAMETFYPEIVLEMNHIAMGVNAKSGKNVVTFNDILGWNMYLSMSEHYNKQTIRCSAFIATGKGFTVDGDIVMGHNTHSDYGSAVYQNVALKLVPSSGNTIFMQTAPGLVASSTDWFMCSNGIMGCETTISNINYRISPNEADVPYFCRIRRAMQYANTLDEYHSIMVRNNLGDYPCGWLLGDANTGEIMLLELGKHNVTTKRTKNGVFYGVNLTQTHDLYLDETNYPKDMFMNYAKYDIPVMARRERMLKLLLGNENDDTIVTDSDLCSREEIPVKIDLVRGKTILSDHYDMHDKTNKGSKRTICKHSNNESCELMNHFGTTDCKLMTGEMAKHMTFFGIYGSGCGNPDSVGEKKWVQQQDWTIL